MSRHHFLIAVIGFILALGFGIYITKNSSDTKLAHLKTLNFDLKHTEKISGPLAVKLVQPQNSSLQAGDVFSLKAQITTTQALDKIQYHWHLPNGIELVSVILDDQLLPTSNEPIEVEVVLRKISDGNDQIHFTADSEIGSMKFSQTAQFNTRDQAAIDASVRALSKRTRKYLIENPAQQKHKIFE